MENQTNDENKNVVNPLVAWLSIAMEVVIVLVIAFVFAR